MDAVTVRSARRLDVRNLMQKFGMVEDVFVLFLRQSASYAVVAEKGAELVGFALFTTRPFRVQEVQAHSQAALTALIALMHRSLTPKCAVCGRGVKLVKHPWCRARPKPCTEALLKRAIRRTSE